MFKGTIPTDNLYKFAAIFGLVIVIASFAALLVVSAPEFKKLTLDRAIRLNLTVPERTQWEQQIHETTVTFLFVQAGISGFFLLLGLAISGLGFFAWFWRKQIFEDQHLIAEASQAIAERDGNSIEAALRRVQLRKQMDALSEEEKKTLEDWDPKLI